MVQTPREFSAFTQSVRLLSVSDKNGQRPAAWSLTATGLSDTPGKILCPNHSEMWGRARARTAGPERLCAAGYRSTLHCPFAGVIALADLIQMADQFSPVAEGIDRTPAEGISKPLAQLASQAAAYLVGNGLG